MSKIEPKSNGHTRPKTFYIYGEDGLTLKFLLERLDIVLDQLDKSDPNDCEVYYRPSFGRGVYYGEFDAIILTPKHAYLVESKWDRSSGLSKGLREEQTERHNILTWLSDKWKGKSDEDWNRFRTEFQKELNERFDRKEIPPTHSGKTETTLSKNLRTVLPEIGNRISKNVLLIFHQGKKPIITQEGFEIAYVEYCPTHGLYLELEDQKI